MKFTKLLPYILLSVVALVACSCDGGAKDNPHRARIGFSQCSEDDWRDKMNSDMLREAMLYDNIDIEIRISDSNTDQQIADIRRFIEEGIDLLVVCPNEAMAITPVVEEAYRLGIPVIVADRKVQTDCYSAFVGANNYHIGQAVGQYVHSLLPDGGKVIEVAGLMTSTPAVERHQGFTNTIRALNREIDVECLIDAQWKQDSSYQQMLDILAKHKDVDLVFAHNDQMAYGAYCAAKKLGIEKRIKFIGIDALPGRTNGLGMVADGVLDATFIYPSGVDKILKIASDIIAGRKVARQTTLSTAIVNASNVAVMELQEVHIKEQEQKIELLNQKNISASRSVQIQRQALFTSLIAFMIVVLLAVLLVFLLRRQHRLNAILVAQNEQISQQKRSQEEQSERLVELSQQIEEATQAKLQFFTNVSHDLRTPLSLISGPLEQLTSDNELSDEQREAFLHLAKKNVDSLTRLVNQILDFRKYENGKLHLNKRHVNLLSAMEVWNASFVSLLRSKFIKFSFSSMTNADYTISVDLDKFEQVYYNLLSNAFKFTPENGVIKVELFPATLKGKPCIRLKVYNSGSYISEDNQQLIFDRFYQVTNTENNSSGSGIGLAVTKIIVNMHEGDIRVESKEGYGTTFYVDLPLVREVESVEQEVVEPTIEEDEKELFNAEELEVVKFYDDANGGEKMQILVIDDNSDILSYVSHILGDAYTIITATNGKEGIEKAISIIPDLIISDVMMPVMDGLTCTQKLKSMVQTSHIPIILLTAYSSDEQKLAGVNSGADAHMTKPFNAKLLKAMVHNLIDNRSNLRRYFTDNHIAVRTNDATDTDKQFIEHFRVLVEQNIENAEFNIEDMGKEIGMSIVQLYRKVKALTGLAPKEYLRISRLKYADHLLATTKLNINEIAYKCGFSSPNYFSKCYKDYFGRTPKSNRGN